MSVGWRSLGHGVSVGWESWGHQGVSVGSSCCGMSVGSWGSPRGICGVIGWWGVCGLGVMGSWGHQGVSVGSWGSVGVGSGVMGVHGCLWGHRVVGCLWGGGHGVMEVTKGFLLCGGRRVVGCLWGHGGLWARVLESWVFMGVCGVWVVGSWGHQGVSVGSWGICGVWVLDHGGVTGVCGVEIIGSWGICGVGVMGSWDHQGVSVETLGQGVSVGWALWGHGVTKGFLLCGGRHVVGCLG